MEGWPDWAFWLSETVAQARPVWEAARASEWFLPLVGTVGVLLLVMALGRRRRRAGGAGRVVQRRGQPCRWSRSPGKRTDNLQRWQCRVCGVDAFTGTGRPPVECKRNLRETQL